MKLAMTLANLYTNYYINYNVSEYLEPEIDVAVVVWYRQTKDDRKVLKTRESGAKDVTSEISNDVVPFKLLTKELCKSL